MSIERANFDDVSEADLEDLIQAGRPEGLTIEYKRDPYGNSHSNRTEALKDITSFANSAGGHLIIGMDEANGVPTELTGLQGDDPGALIDRLGSLVRDGVEPRIVGVRMRRVDLSSGGAALVIRIPRSWNPPHRVTTGGHSHFYIRNSGGAHPADVEELRVLFTLAADAHQRIKNFRSERIKTIIAGGAPAPLAKGGRLFVHLIPLSAFAQVAQIDLERAYQVHEQFEPMVESMGMTARFNLDGIISVRGSSVGYGYTQVFRNGIVEATEAEIKRPYNNMTILQAGKTLRHIVEALPRYFEGLRALDVPPPIVLMVSYEGVAGAKLAVHGYDVGKIEPFPRVDPLLLPEAIVEDYGSPEHDVTKLKPAFDALWNAAGFARCTYYDTDGNWRPPR